MVFVNLQLEGEHTFGKKYHPAMERRSLAILVKDRSVVTFDTFLEARYAEIPAEILKGYMVLCKCREQMLSCSPKRQIDVAVLVLVPKSGEQSSDKLLSRETFCSALSRAIYSILRKW